MSLRARLSAGETVFSAWSAIPDPLVAEFLARAPFDVVTLDMQHGCHSTDSVLRGIAAVTLTGKPAVVRVPIRRFDMATRALDFGATAVIAPMVNSADDARAFAGFMKFPPLGERSWGPSRGLALMGQKDPQAYLKAANRDTLAIAMVETRAAVAALDDILAVEGIDGIFVGPADFSIALSDGARVDPHDKEMLAATAEVVKCCASTGKIPCTLATTAEAAQRFQKMGFRFIALASDIAYLTSGATALIEASRR
jgi:4-hydroxy-2-oxoheptanedioate aldolase